MDRQTIRHDPPVNQDSTGDVRENEASSRGSRKRLGNRLVHVTACFWQRQRTDSTYLGRYNNIFFLFLILALALPVYIFTL